MKWRILSLFVVTDWQWEAGITVKKTWTNGSKPTGKKLEKYPEQQSFHCLSRTLSRPWVLNQASVTQCHAHRGPFYISASSRERASFRGQTWWEHRRLAWTFLSRSPPCSTCKVTVTAMTVFVDTFLLVALALFIREMAGKTCSVSPVLYSVTSYRRFFF